tara:strand:- start:1025 stop:1207 length:183 start_codon:yes stop_codon:yes gene_type:complete
MTCSKQLTLSTYEVQYVKEFLDELRMLIDEDDGTFFPMQLVEDHEIICKIMKGASIDMHL